MSGRLLFRNLARLAFIGILLSIIFMIQPLVAELFKPGFFLLVVSTILFTVFSHLSGPSDLADTDLRKSI